MYAPLRLLLRLVGLLVALASGGAHLALAADFSEAELLAFLQTQNRDQAVLVQSLVVSQAGDPAPLYDQVGREELRNRKGQQPILAPANPVGPFVRNVRWVARIDRSRDITVTLQLQTIRSNRQSLTLAPVHQVLVRYRPDRTYVRHALNQGRLHLVIPASPARAGCHVLVLTGSERHLLQLDFSHGGKPFTQATPQP